MRPSIACLALIAATISSSPQIPRTITLRGRPQTLHPYGPPAGDPVIVSSGDGGWIHLGPHVAQLLAARGFAVTGFDVKAYLASFTSGPTTLRAADEPRDYGTLLQAAIGLGTTKPILVGVSEGAGLSVLATSDPRTKANVLGIVAVGLPDWNELGWRWKDAITYLTHKIPNEPTFSVAAIASDIAPIPLAAIHSTHDEYVPLAEVERVMQHAAQPKRLWVVNASDHRFSDNLSEFDERLLDAIAWIQANASR
ncbi:MAG TPA: AcvB/VirJ family lysyl-phosphatidylglycerol hydrolase [Vicinamibacterales bacterium]|jgi:pimeloyl-ACP methyl ester carboxylesterase